MLSFKSCAKYQLVLPMLMTLDCVGCSDQAARTNEHSGISNQADTSKSSVKDETPALLSSEQIRFGHQWKAASLEKRQTMAAVNKIGSLFLGATKAQIKEALGEPDKSGVDNFGEDVMRYELGPLAGFEDNRFQSHLTFVFKNNAVVNVMGNSVSFP